LKQLIAIILTVQLSVPAFAFEQSQPGPIPQPPAASQPPAPQTAAPQTAAPQAPVIMGSLKIQVLEGEGAVNNIQTRQGTPPVVEVLDANDRPVEGASVVFRMPPTGAGAVFPGGELSKSFTANAEGQVIASGLLPNRTAGRFRIHVTASSGNRLGETDIVQTNSSDTFAARQEPKRKLPKWWKWVAIGVGAAAVGGIIAATRGGSSSSPGITVTPGPVTISGH